MATRRKVPADQIKTLAAQGAQTTIEFFLGDPSVKKAYIKVLRDAGMSHADIAKATHSSTKTIADVCSGKDVELEEGMVETLKGLELNRLYFIGSKILQVMSDPGKIEGMKGGDLAYAYKTFLEARRLLENKSTGNISVLITTLTKKFEEEGGKIDRLMQGIAKKVPELKEEGAVAELHNPG